MKIISKLPSFGTVVLSMMCAVESDRRPTLIVTVYISAGTSVDNIEDSREYVLLVIHSEIGRDGRDL